MCCEAREPQELAPNYANMEVVSCVFVSGLAQSGKMKVQYMLYLVWSLNNSFRFVLYGQIFTRQSSGLLVSHASPTSDHASLVLKLFHDVDVEVIQVGVKLVKGNLLCLRRPGVLIQHACPVEQWKMWTIWRWQLNHFGGFKVVFGMLRLWNSLH